MLTDYTTDPVKVREALAGNPGAVPNEAPAGLQDELAELYASHSLTIYRYAYAMTHSADMAAEAVQESFVRYLQWRQGGHAVDNPGSWLYRVARNYLLDSAKASRRNVEIDAPEAQHVQTAESHEMRMCQRDLVSRMKDKLSPRELECVSLRAAGFRYHEVAAIMGVQLSTISGMLGRAMEKTRKLANRHRDILP